MRPDLARWVFAVEDDKVFVRRVSWGLSASLVGFLGVAGCSSGEPSGASATAGSSSQTATTAAAASGEASATATGTGSATASSTATATAAAESAACPAGMVLLTAPARLCMSKTEVTVTEYRACVDAKKCSYVPRKIAGCNWDDGAAATHPMNCVGRSKAEEYCAAQGGRLPSVSEWERASRDGEDKPYAWGTADPQKEAEDKFWCWSGKTPRKGTCPAGSFPAGATKAGLLDMTGNAAEWATGDDTDEKSKTCGRAWDAAEGWKAMEKCPGGYFAEAQVPLIGFRCVAAAK